MLSHAHSAALISNYLFRETRSSTVGGILNSRWSCKCWIDTSRKLLEVLLPRGSGSPSNKFIFMEVKESLPVGVSSEDDREREIRTLSAIDELCMITKSGLG